MFPTVKNSTSSSLTRQRGVSLVMSLIFLVLLTLIGVSAMTTTTLEEKMTGSERDRAIAMQAAEAALRDAEMDIDNRLAYPTFTGKRTPKISGATGFGVGSTAATCSTAGLCLPPAPDNETYFGKNFPANAQTVQYGTYTGATAIAGVTAQPRYVIEAIPVVGAPASWGSSPPTHIYRITARGFGARATTKVTVQSVYRQGT